MAQNKKDFTNIAADVFVSKMQTAPQPAKVEEPKPTTAKPKPRQQKKQQAASTAAAAETKITFWLSHDLDSKLRYLTYVGHTSIKKVITQALQDYVTKYEKSNGEIKVL